MNRIAIAILTAFVVTLGVGATSAQAAEITPAQLAVGDSTQVMAVTSSSWTTSYPTLQTWQKNSDGTWSKPFGP